MSGSSNEASKVPDSSDENVAPDAPQEASGFVARVRRIGRATLQVVGFVSKFVFLTIIRFYQKFISPMTPPSCRFYPSCSQYAITALQTHGLLRGTWLAVRRVSRCHPWNPGGVDHVPPRRGSSPEATASPLPSVSERIN